MDEGNEPAILADSPAPTTPVNLENDLVAVPPSTIDSHDIPPEETNSENFPASGLDDETPNQELINDTEDHSTDMITDSVTEDLPNETLSDVNAEEDQVPDAEPDTNDSLNDSNLDDSVSENGKRNSPEPDQKTEKISQFPLSRVRDIIKSDPDVRVVHAECVFLVAKATEMFLQRLAKEIHRVTRRNKKKTLQKKDLEAAISENVAFEFLEGALN